MYVRFFFCQGLGRPILYSNWLSKNYIPVEREELRDYVKARLKVYQYKIIILSVCTVVGIYVCVLPFHSRNGRLD